MAIYQHSERSSSVNDAKDDAISDPGMNAEGFITPIKEVALVDVEKASVSSIGEFPPPSPPLAAPPAAVPGVFNPTENPDGGREAWMVVAGGFCVLFCSFGYINSIGVFQDYYQEGPLRSLSPSTIAWIPSLEVFFMMFLGPWVGAILDRYGYLWLLVVGTFLHVFGVMMISLCTEYYQFILAQGICSPIGVSMIFFPAQAAISQWFWKRRALAFGIVAAGSSLGGVIIPIMVQRLIVEVGFGWSLRILAFLMLGLLVIAIFTVKPRVPPRPKPFVFVEFLHPLKELPFDLLTIGAFLFFLGFFIPINYIIEQAQYSGMSPNLAQYLVSILNAASFAGRVLPGWIADKVGRFNTMVVISFFSAILILALWIPAKTNAPIIVFAALFGFGSGAFVSLSPSLIAQISEVPKIGVRTGTYFALISIATLISNPIGGAIIVANKGSFLGLQIFSGASCLIGAAIILASRISLAGFKVSTKV